MIGQWMWRLSKYDPALRDQMGVYRGDDWTSVSDIGKVVGGKVLEFSEYLEVENAYVEAIVSFFQIANIQKFSLQQLERTRDWDLMPEESRKGLPKVFPKFEQGAFVGNSDLDCFIRLVLREVCWGKLVNEARDAYLHFGYDFYVYVGAKGDGLRQWIPPHGIFAEPMVSPYLD